MQCAVQTIASPENHRSSVSRKENRSARGLCKRFAASLGGSWSFVPWAKELGEHLPWVLH